MSVPSGSDEVSSVDENLPRGTPTPPPENQIQDTIHGRTVPKTTEQTVAGQCTVPSEIGDQIREFLINHIKTARPGLSRFYKDLDDNPALEAAIPRAEAMVRRMVSKKCSLEEALSMSPISLYDVVMLLDNSPSMICSGPLITVKGKTKTNGTVGKSAKLTKRQITLEETLVAVTDIVQRACEAKSIALRFLNRPDLWDKINTRKVCNIVRNKVVWEGTTPIGTMLKRRILDEFVKEDMERPVLVIIVTDGMIEGEPEGLLRKVIHKQALELQRNHGRYGPQAVSYQFATIGDDPGAKSLMKSLDDDKELKHLIDCMLEKDDKLEDIRDTKKKWAVLPKLLLGAISKHYDDFLPQEIEVDDSTGELQSMDVTEEDGEEDEEDADDQSDEEDEGGSTAGET